MYASGRMARAAPSVLPARDLTRSSRDTLNLSWLVRVRWGAALGQAITVVVAGHLLDVHFPEGRVWSLIALELVSNMILAARLRAGRAAREGQLAGILAGDILILTALLYLTGGPFNPFSFVYLVYISLAVVLLRSRYAWMLAGLSLGCSALLFLAHLPLEMPVLSHEDHMRWHLWGMWVAFAVAAVYIIYSQVRVLQALAAREAELADARERGARQERLAALATLAGGAAHELASPLSTVAVIACELERELTQRAVAPDLIDDVRLVRAELDHCREILDQMSDQAGEGAGDGVSTASLAELLDRSLSGLPPVPPVRLEMTDGDERLVWSHRVVARAVRALVRNAQDASPPGTAVAVCARIDGGALRVEVADEGAGMTPEVLARAGEPFFTTKQPGQGMGLGLFLCRAIAEQLGGGVELSSLPGRGTTARLVVPIAPPAPEAARP